MASFMTELWESIFTPGPTAPLLKAANASFAALQFVLLALLVATHNVHCIALSVLCAGLWWSVNWFAAELKAAQLREEQDQEKRRAQAAAEDSSDTEVEGHSKSNKVVGDKVGRASASASAEVDALEQTGELKQRGGELPAGTQSSVSTEDEWEKVSEGEREKNK